MIMKRGHRCHAGAAGGAAGTERKVSGMAREERPAHAGIELAIQELRALRQVLASDAAAVLGDCADADLDGIMAMVEASIDTYAARLEAARKSGQDVAPEMRGRA